MGIFRYDQRGNFGSNTLSDLHGAFFGSAGQQRNKLVPTQPDGDLVGAHLAVEDVRQLDQHLVPGLVAELIVDRLEVVRINKEDA